MSDIETVYRQLVDVQKRLEALEVQERPVSGIGARVYNSAAISVANATWTTLTFDGERYDTASLHSTVTNTSRLTIATAGVYLVVGHVRFASNAIGTRFARIYLDGATVVAQSQVTDAGGAFDSTLNVTTVYQLSAGNYVELQAWQNSTAALNVVVAGNNSPEFAIQRIA